MYSNYVKYLESAGAWTLLLDWRAQISEIDDLLLKVNGVFFTGGMVDLFVNHTMDPWTLKAKYIIEKAIKFNN